MGEHINVGSITDISGDAFIVCLETDRLYFEGGALDLGGIGQLQVALDRAVTLIRQAGA